ncbi:glycine betaine ABC transporter substrate-binding protein [Dysgonomonas mossii]|uniref:glycine betaine ABC transporter substrate-binding protein n=1 Tax=Dysgonomonas mossii TaxID=163665 RepID=UPI0039922318
MNKIICILLSVLLLGATSCEPRHKQDVLILYPNWAEGIAITYLAKVMLENKGYTVTLKRIEPGPIYTALSRGDADIYMDAWLPHTQKDYWAKYGHKLDVLGTVFDDGITGLVVPAYVNIESIEELNENKDRFDKKIYGIASGAGIHANTEKAITVYNLDYSQISSSETSMITALKKAEKNKEWIVITGWKPHFMWTEFELKKLSDPKGIYPTDNIQVISRRGFKEDKPEIAAFFESFKLDDKLLHELIIDVSMDKNPEIGAKMFFEKYRTFL